VVLFIHCQTSKFRLFLVFFRSERVSRGTMGTLCVTICVSISSRFLSPSPNVRARTETHPESLRVILQALFVLDQHTLAGSCTDSTKHSAKLAPSHAHCVTVLCAVTTQQMGMYTRDSLYRRGLPRRPTIPPVNTRGDSMYPLSTQYPMVCTDTLRRMKSSHIHLYNVTFSRSDISISMVTPFTDLCCPSVRTPP
jgi:hypothetical protein